MPPRKRRTPFQRHHTREYGLSIASVCPDTGAVSSVVCQFCRFFGREDKVGQKRKPSKNTKTFLPPFRVELYTQHHTGQHAAKWAEYMSLSDDDKAMTSLPPCDPLAFARMLPSSFVAVVIRFRSRLEKKFSASYIVALEEEHVTLRDVYTKEEAFRNMLDAIKVTTGFGEAWSLVQQRFPKLCEFAGGLASVYPGTARVESDFSIIGWEKDEFRNALMDVSLEGIMHAKQFKDLHSIHTA